MANNNFIISLESHGQCLYRIASSDIQQEISIGRAHDCTWRLPNADKMASSHHAVIQKNKKEILLIDTGSRNGIFCDGQKVSNVRLCPGKRITIADAELSISECIKDSEISFCDEHMLEHLNGKYKGAFIRINKSRFMIGASLDNDLVIDENLISQYHIELRIDDTGACWIQDMNSTNGTKVNHSALAAGKERMLKDGDVISLACIDLRFLDKNIRHTRSYVGLKITVGIVTIALLVAGYFAYLAVTPNAYELIQKARGLAAEARFDQAQNVLESASSARDFSKFQAERDMLLEQITIWKLTLNEWHSVSSYLKDKKWVDAVRTLSAIQVDRMENWNWNEGEALSYKSLALRVRNNIDLLLQAQGIIDNSDSSIAELRVFEHKLNAAMCQENALKPEEILAPLLLDIQAMQEKISANLRNHDRLNNTLAKLSLRIPNFGTIVAELEEIEKNSQGIVKHLAAKYLGPIRKLRASQGRLLANSTALTCLDFEKIDFNLDLPSIDECAVNPHINTQRSTIVRINENFILAYKQVLYMHNLLKQWNVTPPNAHALLIAFSDKKNLEKILSCDSLLGKLPRRNRKMPQGIYDQMLGIEYFYEFLRSLPISYDGAALDRMKFIPECVSLKKLCEQYSNFVQFAELPENRWLLRGSLLTLRDYCAEQLKMRDSLVMSLRNEKCEPFSRRSIICRGLVIYFSPLPKLEKEYLNDFARDFKKYREPIAVLNNAYETASPEKSLEIRNRILETGLPGDPIVRRMWATKQ